MSTSFNIDTPTLLDRAAAIRDAIEAKSVSARMVGELFFDIAEAAGSLAEGLSVLAAVLGTAKPLRVDFTTPPPAVITCAPGVSAPIAARLFPLYASGSILFVVADGDAASVSPNGVVSPLRPGSCLIYAVATTDCSVFAAASVNVVPPRLRVSASGALRLTPSGTLKLT